MAIVSKSSLLMVILMALTIGYGVARGNDVYIAQSAAGSANGSSCNNAYVYTYFNTSGNWTSGTPGGTQIGPQTTVHICGTLSAPPGASGYLTFQGGGTAGNPVTLLFESGAILTAPYWGSGGAIQDGFSYTLINGGSNGVIQATANGTAYANQQDGAGISLYNASNAEIKNLTISNLYVHAANPSDESGQNTFGIFWNSGSNITIDHNTCHDVRTCFIYGYPGSSTSSGVAIYSNTVYNINWGIIIGDGNGGATLNAPVAVYGNTIYDFSLWDDNANYNHHDGVYCFATNAGSSLTACSVYNNYIYGDPGTHDNTFIFVSQNTSGMSCSGIQIFNNVLANTSAADFPANGLIQDWCTNSLVVNNTLVSSSGGPTPLGIVCNLCVGETSENNIIDTFSQEIYLVPSTGTYAAIDYNNYYNFSTLGNDNVPHYYSTLSSWQACTANGCPTAHDAHSFVSDPSLSTSYVPSSGSAVISAGANLTSLGISALDFDYAGNARPSTGAWTIGAYQNSASGGQTVNPPTGVSTLTQ